MKRWGIGLVGVLLMQVQARAQVPAKPAAPAVPAASASAGVAKVGAPKGSGGAASAADQARARKLLAEGKLHLQLKKYEPSLQAFEQSLQLDPQAAAFKGKGDALRALTRWREAHAAYTHALASTQKPPLTAAERKAVEGALAEAEKATGVVQLAVSEAGASVRLDGQPVSEGELKGEIRLAPGPHRLEVSKALFVPVTKEFSLGAGERQKLEIALSPQQTTGTLVVREKEGRPAHVVIAGLDVGEAPWTTNALPGSYEVQLLARGVLGPAQAVQIEVGKTAELAVTRPPLPAGECESDEDCNEENRCVSGACRRRPPPPPPPPPPKKTHLTEGEACATAMLSCEDSLRCAGGQCRKPEDVAPFQRYALSLEAQVVKGAAGEAQYSESWPAFGLAFQWGQRQNLRWHLNFSVASFELNQRQVLIVRNEPLQFGWAIPLWHRGGKAFWLEPALMPIAFDVATIESERTLVLLRSGAWLRAAFATGRFFAYAHPLAFDVNLVTIEGDKATDRIGVQYNPRLGVGLLF